MKKSRFQAGDNLASDFLFNILQKHIEVPVQSAQIYVKTGVMCAAVFVKLTVDTG